VKDFEGAADNGDNPNDESADKCRNRDVAKDENSGQYQDGAQQNPNPGRRH
jgi:hypothetical protein